MRRRRRYELHSASEPRYVVALGRVNEEHALAARDSLIATPGTLSDLDLIRKPSWWQRLLGWIRG